MGWAGEQCDRMVGASSIDKLIPFEGVERGGCERPLAKRRCVPRLVSFFQPRPKAIGVGCLDTRTPIANRSADWFAQRERGTVRRRHQ